MFLAVRVSASQQTARYFLDVQCYKPCSQLRNLPRMHARENHEPLPRFVSRAPLLSSSLSCTTCPFFTRSPSSIHAGGVCPWHQVFQRRETDEVRFTQVHTEIAALERRVILQYGIGFFGSVLALGLAVARIAL